MPVECFWGVVHQRWDDNDGNHAHNHLDDNHEHHNDEFYNKYNYDLDDYVDNYHNHHT